MQIKEICKELVAGVHKISNALAWFSSAALLSMALLTFVDVIGRYALNMPIEGTQEIVELLMVLTLYGGLAFATYQRKHIIVDTILTLLPERIQYVCMGIGALLAGLLAFIMAWMMGGQGLDVLHKANIATGTLYIRLGPFYLLAALGCAVLTLEFFFDGLRRFKEAADIGK